MSPEVYRGSLENVPPHTLVRDIYTGKHTGVLCLEDDKRQKSIFFSKGAPVFAVSTEMKDKIGQVLLAHSRVSKEDLNTALGMQQSGEDMRPLGAILVHMESLTPGDLVWGVKQQVKQIFADAYLWSSGSYAFAHGGDPEAWGVITLELSMVELVRHALGQLFDLLRLGDLLALLSGRLSATSQERPDRALFEEAEWDLLGRIEGGADTVHRLLVASPYQAAISARAILLLYGLGIIRTS